MNKVFILLVCELSALGIFIRHTKMSKKPLNLKIRKATSLANFFNRIFIPWKFLTHKADSWHSRVNLDVHFADTILFNTFFGKLLCILKWKNSLRNIIFSKIFSLWNWSVAKNHNRKFWTAFSDFYTLVNIWNSKKIRSEFFINLWKLNCTVAVAVSLYNTTDLCIVCNLISYYIVIMLNCIKWNFSPSSFYHIHFYLSTYLLQSICNQCNYNTFDSSNQHKIPL